MKAISTPPKFVFTANDRTHLPPPNGTARASTPKSRGRPRGTSPAKNTSPAKQSTKKPRATKAAKEADAASAREASASLQATLEDTTPHVAPTTQTTEKPESSESDDNKVHVRVETNIKTKGDETKETTLVEIEGPKGSPPMMTEHAEDVIEAARMVQENNKKYGESSSSKSKRKAEEMDPESDGSADNEVQPAKRAKLLAEELKKEKVRTRALLGVAATLVIGYVHLRLHGLIFLNVADIKDRAIIPLVLPG